MDETLRGLLTVGALSMFKFFLAPFLGAKEGLHFMTTFVAMVTGMNLSVVVFSLFGQRIKHFIYSTFYRRPRKVFSPKSRRTVTMWHKYGMWGVAFLTPALLTPPVGTLIACGFGEDRKRIVLFMFVSSVLWGLLLCFVAYELKEVPFLKKILG
jgi:hypothetical protein